MLRILGFVLSALGLVEGQLRRVSPPSFLPNTTSHFAQVGGHVYHYTRSRPTTAPIGTVLLFHGYPDTAFGWRKQIPFLTSLGYQVITPDMLGYVDTDSPAELAEYTKRKLSTDMALLLDQILPGEQFIVGGHDWGAALAYKMAVWYPDLIRAYFTVSVPYWPPPFGLSAEPYLDVSQLAMNETYRGLGYQLQWREFGFERNFQTREEFYQLLNAAFGGITPDGQGAFSPYTGWNLSIFSELRPNALVNTAEMDYYVDSFRKKGLRGPNNWYRTYRMDWEDEIEVARARKQRYRMPVLFLATSQDAIFTEETWQDMDQYFDNLTINVIDAGHWALQEAPNKVNRALEEWLSAV